MDVFCFHERQKDKGRIEKAGWSLSQLSLEVIDRDGMDMRTGEEITFGCIAMCSAVLFILRSGLFVYSAVSGMNRVQVVFSGFSVILFCPEKNFM